MLTKDAKSMLYELYQEYKVRRQNHLSKSDSRDFKDAESIHEIFFLIGYWKTSKTLCVN